MITNTTSVSDIVRERPGLAPVFEQLNIDYCCGGNRPLADACSERGLDPGTVVSLLNASIEQRGNDDEERVDSLPTPRLIEHIVTRHHTYLRRELPRIVELTQKVATGHADQEPRLEEIGSRVTDLASELLRHLDEEENSLFPVLLDAAEQGATGSGEGVPTDVALVSRLIGDHEAVGATLARIRELTDNYTPPEWACNTTRAVYHSLGELDRDVHQHVHKENNILFPRVDMATAGR